MSDDWTDNLFKRGSHFLVEFALESSGAMPAREFLEQHEGGRHRRSRTKIVACVARLADTRPGEFRDAARFKPVDGEIYEFRADQLRLLCAYNGKGRLLLISGVVKKQNELRPEDIKRARRILQEHRQWDATN